MKKYKPYLTRVDLVKNQVERERIQEQEAKKKRKRSIQEQNKQRHLRYQEQLRSELAARYFHGVVSAGGDADSFTNTYSVALDGTDDYVNVADNSNLSFGNGTTDSPFSISAWIKFDTTGTAFNILDKYNGYPNGEYRFLKLTDDRILIRLISNNGELNRIGRTTSSVASYIGVWIHVVATYNGNSAYNGLKIYVNGVRSDNADNGKNTYTAMKNTLYPVKIGDSSNGNIDEVSIFDVELSSTEVTNIYNSGVPNNLSSISGLVSWWRFEEGSGTTATDSGSGGNNGTLISDATFEEDVPS